MLSDRVDAGFTIVELLIGITIVGILLALGVPAMGTYLQNAKVGAAAQSLQAGIQMARTEAIRRNTQVQFMLTNTPAAAVASDATGAVAAANGANWLVRAPLPPDFTTSELVEYRSGQEGGAAVQMAASSASGAFGGTITFTGIGGTTDATTFRLTNPAAGACVSSGGPVRCWNVRVSGGGQVRTCDPAITATSDSRYCN